MSATLPEKPVTGPHPPVTKRTVETKPAVEKPTRGPPPARNRRWLLMVSLLALVGGGAWYAGAWFGAPRAGAAGEGATAGQSGQRNGRAALGFLSGAGAGGKNHSAAPRVETVAVEVVQRSGTLQLTGSLMADERASVASNTSGICAEVHVDRGSVVRRGDVLVQIDAADAKNKLAEGRALLEELRVRLGLDDPSQPFNPEEQPEVKLAKASRELAAANSKRADELHAKKVISREVFEQTGTELELAVHRHRQARLQVRQLYQTYKTGLARLAILEKAVEDTSIRAPFDGWVAEKLVAVGEQISSGMQATKVLTLVRVDPLRLSLTVPQQSVGHIRPGQTVRFRVDTFPDRTFEGTVRYIAPVVTSDTRSMIVEAVVPNSKGLLRPGAFATAELQLPERKTEILAPLGAVEKLDDAARVFVVRDGVAREQVVALGEVHQQKVEIRSGLAGKELLVARPELVRDGDVVGP